MHFFELMRALNLFEWIASQFAFECSMGLAALADNEVTREGLTSLSFQIDYINREHWFWICRTLFKT